MFKWLAKKYVVGLVNDLIKKLNGKYDVECYRKKIQSILNYLNKLLECLDDGEVTSEEADEIISATVEFF